MEYHSTLAERRRLALVEALEENEQLHHEVAALKQETSVLKAENEMLKPMAEEAEYLSSVLKVNCIFIVTYFICDLYNYICFRILLEV